MHRPTAAITFLRRVRRHALVALVLGTAALTAAQAQASKNCAAVSERTCEIAKALGRGVNFGGQMDAPNEGDWGARIEMAHIDKVAGAFTNVRLPVRWSNHAARTEDATLDERFARRVDEVVDALLARNLYVILNVHNYVQLTGGQLQPKEFAVDQAVVVPRLINIWKQLAVRYKDRSDRLIFEPFNEPSGPLDAAAWNALFPQLLGAIRSSNPTRAVMIGPAYYNNVRDLPKLRLPADDRNIIATVHNYDPFPFTHQGLSWIPIAAKVGTKCCDAAQRKSALDALDAAKRWSDANGYPIYVGEFGTHQNAPLESRVEYTRFIRDALEARGFSWGYWSFTLSFGVYSNINSEWIEPLRAALLD